MLVSPFAVRPSSNVSNEYIYIYVHTYLTGPRSRLRMLPSFPSAFTCRWRPSRGSVGVCHATWRPISVDCSAGCRGASCVQWCFCVPSPPSSCLSQIDEHRLRTIKLVGPTDHVQRTSSRLQQAPRSGRAVDGWMTPGVDAQYIELVCVLSMTSPPEHSFPPSLSPL